MADSGDFHHTPTLTANDSGNNTPVEIHYINEPHETSQSNAEEHSNFTPRRTAIKRKYSEDEQPQQQQQQQHNPMENRTHLLLDASVMESIKSNISSSNMNGSVNNHEGTSHNHQRNDSNHLFCLSLVDTMKSLSPRDNALARMKIQQVLFEIQHGGEEG